VVDRADAILVVRLPHVPATARQRYARVSVQLVWALLPLLKTSDPDERAAFAVELKAVIVRYLSPIWESPAQIREHSEES